MSLEARTDAPGLSRDSHEWHAMHEMAMGMSRLASSSCVEQISILFVCRKHNFPPLFSGSRAVPSISGAAPAPWSVAGNDGAAAFHFHQATCSIPNAFC